VESARRCFGVSRQPNPYHRSDNDALLPLSAMSGCRRESSNYEMESRMTGRLVGRVALVTGSSSGLGQAIALAYSQEGAVVFCVDLYPAERNAININTGKADDVHNRIGGQGTHEKIRQTGGEATYHRADLTKARDVELAVRACVSRYGRLDIMVNNAGMCWLSVI
jgi:NAD(P)-dependent dehydrogenase (short-subunit alcohol dehydrogenase family)